MKKTSINQIKIFAITAFSLFSIFNAIPVLSQNASIYVDASKVENSITPYLYGACIEDVNHEIYGGIYDQKIFGESFEEPAAVQDLSGFTRFEGVYVVENDVIGVSASRGGKIVYNGAIIDNGTFETDIRFDNERGNMAGIAFRVSDPGIGRDRFKGYSLSLSSVGKNIILAKHDNNVTDLVEVKPFYDAFKWNRLKVDMQGNTIEIFLNGKSIIKYTDDKDPFLSGKICFRNLVSDTYYRNISYQKGNNKPETISFTPSLPLSLSIRWNPIISANAKTAFVHDTKNPFNGKYSQAIQLLSNEGIVGVSNMSLNGWGIAVRKDQKFTGRLYLRTTGLKGNVKVALQSADGKKEYASKEIAGVNSKWARFDFDLISNTTDDKARFAVYIDKPGKLWIDQVTLNSTGTDQFKGYPLRSDIAQAMVDQGLTFLRYGGTMVNVSGYRFKSMIGDRDKRPPYRGHWYWWSTNGFGIEEFIQLTEAAGFVPAFSVSIEEDPQDMADMIEYLNGPVTSKWGKMRAENGHPAPYNVKYIGIGNEESILHENQDTYSYYIERFNLLYDAMKSKDANLSLVIAVEWKPQSPEMGRVFKALDGKAEYWDYHPWADPLTTGATVDKKLQEMKDLFRSWNPDTKMKCVIFEENGDTHNMRRTLGHVTLQNAVRRHGDFVLASCAANALQPYRENDNSWNQGQVFFTPTQVWGMPPYYAQQMASRNHQPLRVLSKSTGKLDVTATRDEASKTVVLHIANITPETIKANLDVEGFDNIKSLESITLAGELSAVNTPDMPDKIAPCTKKLDPKAKRSYEFPANSYTILVYKK